MSLADKWADTIYRIATTRKKLRVILTPVGITFWFGLSVLFVFIAIWVDGCLPPNLRLPTPTNIFVSVPLLVIGATLLPWTVYSFFKARGTPVPLNPPQELVTTGLYSRMRNPMILGWSIMLIGLGILLNSFSLTLIFTPLFILLNFIYLKTVEEKEMEKKFGEQYLNYKRSVPMFIPRLIKRK